MMVLCTNDADSAILIKALFHDVMCGRRDLLLLEKPLPLLNVYTRNVLMDVPSFGMY